MIRGDYVVWYGELYVLDDILNEDYYYAKKWDDGRWTIAIIPNRGLKENDPVIVDEMKAKKFMIKEVLKK